MQDLKLSFILIDGMINEYAMPGNLLTEQQLEFLFFKGGCTRSPESIHVKMSH